jgi:hypothetical protein
MKTKLFALAMVALMFAMVFAIPMPLSAVKMPAIYVAPAEQEFESPCANSTEFYVDIKIDMQDTMKELFAFDFNVTWPTTWFKLTKVEVFPPWPEGKYYIVVNATKDGKVKPPYQLAITAIDTATPVTDKVAVVRLWFIIFKEPCYPDSWEAEIKIDPSVLISPTGKSIDRLVYNGTVTITNDAKPDMWVSIPEGKINAKTGEYYIVEWTKDSTFTVEIFVANVTNMFGFEFYLFYNKTILNTDAQMVHIKPLLPPPYELLEVTFSDPDDPWTELEEIHVTVKRPCEKTPITCIEGPIVNIEFETKCPTEKFWYAAAGAWIGRYVLPQNASSLLDLRYSAIMSKCPNERIYIGPEFEAWDVLGVQTQLTTDGGHYCIDWSPDGSKIVYSMPEGSLGIWTMNADGTGKTKICDAGGFPRWATGAFAGYITYYKPTTADPRGPGQLWIMKSDGTGAGLFFAPASLGPIMHDWTADGSKIVFSSVDATGPYVGVTTVGVSGYTVLAATRASYSYWPVWSPDGKKIAYTKGVPNQIYVINEDGTGDTALTTAAPYNWEASWSTRGIVFCSYRDGYTALYAMNADGTNQTRIKPFGGSPDWSPDTTKIAFIKGDDVWVLDIGYELNVYDGTYYFRPSLTDLNQDGEHAADLTDLVAVAKQYGKYRPVVLDPIWGDWTIAVEFTKLAADKATAVDIFDVVAVAKKVCKEYIPIDPVTKLPWCSTP